MEMNTYYTTNFKVSLLSLAAYEADGGCYDDSGNGGVRVSPCDFVCGMTVHFREDETTELYPRDCAPEISVADAWRDSVTGWILLYDWPADAPLPARCGLGGPSVAAIAAAVADGVQDIDLPAFVAEINWWTTQPVADDDNLWDALSDVPGDVVAVAIRASLRR